MRDRDLWLRSYKNFSNWTRLGALVGLTGYFEVYLRTVSALALESDPGVEYGRSGAVDGAVFLKYGGNWDKSKSVESIVHGEWSGRISAYNRLFGQVPAELSGAVGQLEKIRKMRNGVAHKFGRDIGAYTQRCCPSPDPLARLSERRMKDWMGLLDDVVEAVDLHLTSRHIGDYELLWYFHDWKRKQWQSNSDLVRSFKKSVARVLGNGPSMSYCRSVVTHYNSL